MKKNGYLSLTGILLALLLMPGTYKLQAQSQYGNFPFQASFLNKKVPPGIKFPGSGNTAVAMDNGMQLTNTAEGQFGAIYLNNHRFRSKLGIFIEFEYMVYGGSGGDGLCVFFFDSGIADENMNIGANGAGLGYAYNRSDYSSQHINKRREGLRGAYIGIAFDSYGNYSGLRWQGESRVQGIPFSYYNPSGSGTLGKNGNNEVTIRGARRLTDTGIPGMGIGYAGYPVLVSQRTLVNEGFILSDNDAEPKYVPNNQLVAKEPFAIRGGKEFERPTDEGYRKAFIEMYPNDNEGFYITVMIENDNARDTIIYDYNYKTDFYYYENAYYDATGDNYTGYNPAKDPRRARLQVQLPLELKIGFAAATGVTTAEAAGKTDMHVIKNVGIRLPESAEANDDFLDDYFIGTPSIVFKPLLNDIGYTGQVQRHKKGAPDYLDPNSFKFVDANGDVPSNPHELVVAGEGRWVYTSDGNDYNTGTVTFYPLRTFDNQARVRYIIKAKDDAPVGPHGDDAYYSVPATIGVDLIENPNPPRNLITNKMITPMLK